MRFFRNEKGVPAATKISDTRSNINHIDQNNLVGVYRGSLTIDISPSTNGHNINLNTIKRIRKKLLGTSSIIWKKSPLIEYHYFTYISYLVYSSIVLIIFLMTKGIVVTAVFRTFWKKTKRGEKLCCYV